jgi:hypothetical protein
VRAVIERFPVVGRLEETVPVTEASGSGKMIGIVTRSDAMLYFYDLLPD